MLTCWVQTRLAKHLNAIITVNIFSQINNLVVVKYLLLTICATPTIEIFGEWINCFVNSFIGLAGPICDF